MCIRDRGLIGTAWTGENGDMPVAFNEKANTIPVGYVQSGTYTACRLYTSSLGQFEAEIAGVV